MVCHIEKINTDILFPEEKTYYKGWTVKGGMIREIETIVATIRDYQTDTLEGELVCQKECSLADADSGPDFDQEMNEALWDGL